MKNCHILVVEDEAIVAAVIATNLTRHGCRVTKAADGQAAWELIDQSATEFDAILLDRMMPRMDGVTLLRKLRALSETAPVPIIMATSVNDQASILECLQAGADYYLTKPLQIAVLLVVVRAAVERSREQRRLLELIRQNDQALYFLSAATFHFRRLEEAAILAGLLARLCPQPDRVVLGLHELMINAVEHGNLGIGYAEKSRLLAQEDLVQEVQRRQRLPEHADKQVVVWFARTADAILFTVQDQGVGFAWQDYLDFAPERIFDAHGRGIALARQQSFDALEYQGNGNCVQVTVKLREQEARAAITTGERLLGALRDQ